MFNYTKAFPLYRNIVTDRIIIVALGLFVLISGYLIATKFDGFDGNVKKGLLLFYAKRFLRVYPPFVFFIIIFSLLNISGGKKLFKTATLISMISPPSAATLWFVAMIFIFYLIAPLLINMAKHKAKYFLFCAFLFSFALLCNRFLHIFDERLIIFFPAFAAGVFLASGKRLVSNLWLSVTALLLIASIMISFIDNQPIFIWPPLSLFGPLLVFFIVLREEGRIKHFKIISQIGYSGFFMYLLHRPVFDVLSKVYLPQSGVSQIFYLTVICLPIIIVFSWILQKSYDKLLVLFTPKLKQLVKNFYQKKNIEAHRSQLILF